MRAACSRIAFGLSWIVLLAVAGCAPDQSGSAAPAVAAPAVATSAPSAPAPLLEPPQRPAGSQTLTLSDARLFMAGGHIAGNRPMLFDPATGASQELAASPHGRYNPILAELPEQRVLVAGDGQAYSRCGEAPSYVIDVFDLQDGSRTQLPDLPFPLCSVGHYPERPQLLLAPDGALLATGHLEPFVMRLASEKHSDSGFAARWNIIGHLSTPRMGGIPVFSGDGSLELSAGRHLGADGRCCAFSGGVDHINLGASRAAYDAVAFRLRGVGTARRNEHLLLAGGRRQDTFLSKQTRYSDLFEWLDLRDGTVRTAAPLPFRSGEVELHWIDDARLAAKGVSSAGSEGRAYRYGHWLSSSVPHSSGDAAIYHVESDTWTLVELPGHLQRARMLATVESGMLLLGDDGTLYEHALDGGDRELGRAFFLHSGGTQRVLGDARVVLAGGWVPAELVAVADPGCPAMAECEEKYLGMGEAIGARRHQIFEPGTVGGRWRLSEPSVAGGGNAAIAADGRVFKLGWVRGDGQAMRGFDGSDAPLPRLEVSNAAGTRWSTLPLPEELLSGNVAAETCRPDAVYQCRPLLLPDPRQAGRELLFLRAGVIEVEGDPPPDAMLQVWWFDDHAQRWLRMFRQDAGGSRSTPIALPSPLSSEAQCMRSLGWHVESPALWLAPAANGCH